jgi:hypothetical protein
MKLISNDKIQTISHCQLVDIHLILENIFVHQNHSIVFLHFHKILVDNQNLIDELLLIYK